MAGFFDESYYLKHKVDQLAKAGISAPDGTPYTVETLKSSFAELGINPEDHYKAYGRNENLNPNAYFNETEYLAAKKALLAESDPSWAGKSIAELRQAMDQMSIDPASHYDTYGAFEANSKGVLLNPSNTFDANAYFAAKLVQLKAAGVEGADTMTVAQVVETMRELARLCALAGNPETALTCLQQALALQPDYAPTWFTLATVLKDCGDFPGALECFRKAIALQPDFAEAHAA